jgi:hypothetical protein
MLQIIKNFLVNHYQTIIKALFGLFILYWLIFFLTPKIEMSAVEKEKIDSVNIIVKEIYKNQKKLDSSIVVYNKKLDEVDNHINKIKGQKTIIKKNYYEKINRVDSYTNNNIDSFFTNRYK